MLLGHVADATGERVAGARVTVFWSPPDDPAGTRTDRVEATSDERGRFVVKVLPGRGYSAFAMAGQGPGPVRCSAIRDGIAASGQPLELVLTETAVARPVRLRGTDAWQGRGPLQLFAAPSAANALRIPVDLRDGRALLPPLPGLSLVVVCDRDGEWIALDGVRPDDASIELPSTHAVAVRTVDEKGNAIAGATISACSSGLGSNTGLGTYRPGRPDVLAVLGRTGDDGTATVHVPCWMNPWLGKRACMLVARAPGRAPSCSGWDGNSLVVAGVESEVPADRVLTFVLRPADTLRVVAAPGERLLSARIAGPIESARGQRLLQFAASAEPAAAGAPEIALARPASGGDLVVESLGEAGNTIFTLVHDQAGERIDLGVDGLRRVSVRVQRADGRPAAGIPVCLIHATDSSWGFYFDPLFTDPAGRLDLRFGAGIWALLAYDEPHAAWRTLAADGGDERWDLVLEPLPRMELRVVDGEGRPVAGARARVWESLSSPLGAKVTAEQRLLVPFAHLHHAEEPWACSDADGRITLTAIPAPELRVRFAVTIGDTMGTVLWQPSEVPVEVVLQ